jgi:hypothetical protein
MAAHKHGKKGRVSISRDGGDYALDYTHYPATEWDGDDMTAGVEVTNTESDGYQEMDDEGEITSLNGNITIVARADQAAPTTGMANLVLFEGGRVVHTDAIAFKAFIESVKRSNKVNGTDAVLWQLAYKSSGVITRGSTTVDTPYVAPV